MTTKIIFVFGDSSAWGAYDLERGGWVERLKTSLFEKIFVYNLGVESNTTDDLLKRFDGELKRRIYYPECAELYCPIIIFGIGKNDSIYNNDRDNTWVKVDKFMENLNELIEKARKFTKDVIFLGLPRVDEKETIPFEESGESYCNENLSKYNLILERICREKKIHFIPTIDLLTKEDLYDGLHPNSEGHRKIFERVKEFLEKEKILED